MANGTNRVKVNNPNSLVFIYNYRDRLGDFKLSNVNDPFEVDQIILNSVSLKSVQTQKTKASPAGSFEFRLAPTKNWVTAITPGSWCVILMSNSKINDSAKYGGGSVDERSFKMLGRIESVRAVVNTNQVTGARETEYIVTGVDWGTIFDSKFYVDVLNRAPNESAVGMAERFGYTKYLLDSIGFDANSLGQNAKSVPKYVSRPTQSEEAKASVANNVNFLLNGTDEQEVLASPDVPLNAQEGQEERDTKVRLPSARDNVKFILSLWGRSDAATSALEEESGLVAKSQQVFKLPNQLAKYMGLVDRSSEISPVISQVLEQISGVLEGDDSYTNDDKSSGIVNFNTILGEHSVWQILNNNCNSLINELIPEIRFEDGTPKLCIYNRTRPFAINEDDEISRDGRSVGDNEGAKKGETVSDLVSQYKLVRKKLIDTNDVILCNYGTNWRDRINFIEVNIARSLFQENYAADIKLDSQFVDQSSIGRDGLLSMISSTTYIPTNEGFADPIGVIAYKHILKEWYFNTHKMFNGSLNLIGQDQYIQVGDNILVSTKALNSDKNLSAKQNQSSIDTYMMAHVESISHQTVEDGNGSRVFTTSVNFVRGIITDINGNLISSEDIAGAVDQDGILTTPTVERNDNVFGTSGSFDPDRQKTRGRSL